jgi:hypothetical protein
MPASEAAAERLFSTFAFLWDDHRMRALDDLVQAELIIKHAMLHHFDMVIDIGRKFKVSERWGGGARPRMRESRRRETRRRES